MQENSAGIRFDSALVISDDTLTGTLLASWMQARLGFADVACRAATPQQAADGADLSLIVLDGRAMSGHGASDVAALRHRHAQARIVVLCEARDPAQVFALVQAGAAGVVDRNCSDTRLIRILRSVLDGLVILPDWTCGSAAPVAACPLPAALLTPRQRDVLTLIVEGRSNKDIARRLSLAEGTVKCHVAEVLRRLDVSSRAAASARGVALLAQDGAPTLSA